MTTRRAVRADADVTGVDPAMDLIAVPVVAGPQVTPQPNSGDDGDAVPGLAGGTHVLSSICDLTFHIRANSAVKT